MKASPFTVMGSAGPSTAEWRLAGHRCSTELLYLESRRISTAGDLQLKLLTGRDENHGWSGKKKIPAATKEKAASFSGIATNSSSLCIWWQWWDVSAMPGEEIPREDKSRVRWEKGQMLEDPVASHCAEQRRQCAQGGTWNHILHLRALTHQCQTHTLLTHQHTRTILLAMGAPPDTLLP